MFLTSLTFCFDLVSFSEIGLKKSFDAVAAGLQAFRASVNSRSLNQLPDTDVLDLDAVEVQAAVSVVDSESLDQHVRGRRP